MRSITIDDNIIFEVPSIALTPRLMVAGDAYSIEVPTMTIKNNQPIYGKKELPLPRGYTYGDVVKLDSFEARITEQKLTIDYYGSGNLVDVTPTNEQICLNAGFNYKYCYIIKKIPKC